MSNRVKDSDLSNGDAEFKIPVINDVDDDDVEERFVYISRTIYTEKEYQPRMKGCKCQDQCLPESCSCIVKSSIDLYKNRIDLSGDFPQFHEQVLYECTEETCKGCKGKCSQRLTPEKFNLKVELFKTPSAGFGVRSQQYIESGTFVGEFVGEFITGIHQENRPQDYAYHLVEGKDFYVDPFTCGNITRFFNHSCFENLSPFRFYSLHRDKSRPSIGFFACRDILPGHEMTIDYGEAWWKGQIKKAYKDGKPPLYCQCESLYCINPAPGKRQLPDEKAKVEMRREILSDHEKLEEWKRKNNSKFPVV